LETLAVWANAVKHFLLAVLGASPGFCDRTVASHKTANPKIKP